MFWLIGFIVIILLYRMLLTDMGSNNTYNYREYEDEGSGLGEKDSTGSVEKNR